MLFTFYYVLVRNDEIKMFNQSIIMIQNNPVQVVATNIFSSGAVLESYSTKSSIGITSFNLIPCAYTYMFKVVFPSEN